MSFFDEAMPQPIPQQRMSKTPTQASSIFEGAIAFDGDIQTLWSQNIAMYEYITKLTTYLADQAAVQEVMQDQIDELLERVAVLEMP